MQAYIYQADIYCAACAAGHIADCAREGVTDNGDSDTFPQGPFANGGGEADSPQHCYDCDSFLENVLTPGRPERLAYWTARNRP